MAAVFRDKTIRFRGQDYVVTASNRWMRRLEGDVSFSRVMMAWAKGEPMIGAMCYAIADLLRMAGAKVTEDDVHQEVAHGGEAGLALLTAFMEAITPAAPETPAAGE